MISEGLEMTRSIKNNEILVEDVIVREGCHGKGIDGLDASEVREAW